MGSLATLAAGSAEFALDSGSTLADMGTSLPSLALSFLAALLDGIAVDLVASVAD
ncbi:MULTISPECIES: hypothetical protein [Dietzia]|uniref:MFS transporter n=1 Tax=Dietzia cinnamea TaxID=321318 RepID=A0A4R3ZUK3_9ACTN|nr:MULTISPECIES: hypothetical protein [Dietzia]MBM7229340.1 hypothetical protein [Dietzia cinnamea]MCT1641619.1 hypothetical protein [Dietzia cinnamea]MCT1712990.1 hypothetical protein [Dietzia cinnamea]MCT1865895.1 hypothetical protein [Dietzia cinnamea]MCT2031930.1 hypothetical protein [Dietzia cinnamea]